MLRLNGVKVAEFVPEIADNLTTNDSTKALSATQGKVLNDKVGNSKIYNYFNAPLTFEVDLPFIPSSSIGGSALIYNGNQGYCGLIKVDSTPNIARIIGNAELSVSISGSKLTITSNNRLWGSTTIIMNWN